MGIDFVRKAAPSFHKGLDRRRIELGTPNLFTQEPACAPRAYAANVRNGQSLHAGEEVCVHLSEADQVVVFRGLDPIAVFNSPSTELIEALRASHGEAGGIVQEVHDMAHIAEIAVC